MTTAATACLNCHVPLVPGTGFCGTCGTPAGQYRAATQAPPMQPMPPGFSGGVSATVALPPISPAAAPGHLASALAAAGATVTGTAAGAVAFTATRRSKRTLGFRARFRGVADVAPGGGGATLRVKLEPFSIVPTVLVLLVVCYIGFFNSLSQDADGLGDDAAFAAGQLAAPLAIAILVPYFMISRGGARAVLDLMARAVSGGAAAGSGFAPPPAAAPAAAAVIPVDGLFDQLRELGTLRDQGVLSAAEHDQARAALLAKLT